MNFDPATELIAAASACLAGKVCRAKRARLDAAAESLPDCGLPLPWYRLADAARAWCARVEGRDFPTGFEAARLIVAACDSPPPPSFGWQRWAQ